MSDKFQNNNIHNQKDNVSAAIKTPMDECFRFCLNKTLIKWFCLSLTLGIVVLGNINLTFAQNQPYAWGDNYYGEFGDGTSWHGSSVPRQITGLTNVTAFSVGTDHSLALREDGTVWTWGRNHLGQLGDGTKTNSWDRFINPPAQVSGLTNVTAISACDYHNLVLRSDGTVWGWGHNRYGQLGDGTYIDRSLPVQVSGLTNITAISTGRVHTLAIRSDGTAWAWGTNISGALGDGTITTRNTPVQVSGLTNVIAISASSYSGYSLALTSDGTVWTWGDNYRGQLGDGTTVSYRATPVQLSGLTNITAISAGGMHSLAIKSGGTVWAWGLNENGQVGNGTITNRSIPVQVSGLTNVTAISAGYDYSHAIKSDGTVWAWGNNWSALFGNGTITNSNVPVQVIGLTNAIAIDGEFGHVFAIVKTATQTGGGGDGGDPNGPQVTNVAKTYSGFFLKGFNQDSVFTATVNWKGIAPGRVRFQVNNNAPVEVAGTASGASKTYNLNLDFTPSSAPSLIKISAINGNNVTGIAHIEKVYVFPHPSWLSEALSRLPGALNFSAAGGVMKADFNVEYPTPPFVAKVTIPDFVPLLYGDLGIEATQGKFKGFATSAGTGNLTLEGRTGFTAMGGGISGNAAGSGDFLLNQNGLAVTGASFGLNIQGTIEREAGVVDAIPQLRPLSRFRVIRRFNDTAKLKGTISPSIGFNASWKQDPVTGQLKFSNGTGTVGFQLKGVLSGDISDRISAQGWLGGGGSMTLGVPEPYVRNMIITAEAGVQIKVDTFFGSADLKKTKQFKCEWTASSGQVDCSQPGSFANMADSNMAEDLDSPNFQLKLIKNNYRKFGKYEGFHPNAKASKELVEADNSPNAKATKELAAEDSSQTSEALMAESSLVTNVFAGANPTITAVGNNGRMMLYVRQNPSLPVMQSTDIAWSYNDGTTWSTPSPIASDTRAEMSPVTSVDANGKVVAAWLRIKDPAFTTPIPTMDDLPQYYKHMEVVSAVFDPATRTWSSVTQLTDDLALDTALRLSSDAAGKLLLTWQSNPSGEFDADAANPATLKYSFWNGTVWNAPGVVAGNLVGISEQAVAVRGTNAFIILPTDPNLDLMNDRALSVYNWNGTAWSAAAAFAGGSVDNLLPSAAYDSTGQGQVLWLRGTDIVQATLSDTTPKTVRAGSGSMAFYNARLLTNPQGNLTLVWQEVSNKGAANIFGAIYDTNSQTWSADVRLNVDEWQASDAGGYYSSDGKLQLVYLATQINRVTKTVTVDGQTFNIPNIPENGQTDIRLLEHTLRRDLAVTNSDLNLSTTQPTTGEAMTANVTVHNAGDFSANNFNVNLYAGDPAAGGILLGSNRVTEQVPAGSTRTVNFTFNYPSPRRNIVAIVDAANEISESPETNNTAVVYLENSAPTARITSNVTSGATPLAVNFDASSSTDPEADSLSYKWVFNDGSQSASGAQISHTFTQTGLYPVMVIVTDSKGASDVATVNITAGCQTVTINPAALPNGTVNTAYQQALTATGGAAPYQYYISGGALPAGLTLSQAGQLSGTPTEAGTFNFTVGTSYAANCPGSRYYSLTVTNNPPQTYTISGRMTNGSNSLPGVTVALSGSTTNTATTDSLGNYSFTVNSGGSYTVTPSQANYRFTPPNSTFNNITSNQTANFAATAGLEGDVSPRPDSDNMVQSSDVVQVRRFQNGTATPSTNPNEFQRADSAPFSTKGDGCIRSDDVVQTRRYQNGTTPPELASGPTSPGSCGVAAGIAAEEQSAAAEPQNHQRQLRVESTSGSANSQVTVNIRVDSIGNEAEYGFILNFDPNVLSMPVILAGDAGASVRSCNIATAGRINCSVGGFPNNQAGSSDGGIGEIAPGDNVVLIKVTFTISPMAQPGTTPLTLSNVNASSDVPVLFFPTAVNGTVTIAGPTAATVSISGRVTAKRRGVSGAVVQITKQTGEIQTARTTRFGYYTFKELAVGETYIFNVFSKRFQFNTQVINLTEDLSDTDFTAQ